MSEPASWLQAGWMQTYTGRQFYPARATAADIDPVDVAHALSLTCRYGGHTSRFYSVAEHCVLLAGEAEPEDAAWALLHDAAEAYIGDVVRPVKALLPEFSLLEDRLLAVIAERFGLEGSVIPRSVVELDNRILFDERAALLARPPAPWAVEDLAALGVPVVGWAPRVAEGMFMEALGRYVL